jgi:hypothetical protein
MSSVIYFDPVATPVNSNSLFEIRKSSPISNGDLPLSIEVIIALYKSVVPGLIVAITL